MVGAGRPSRTGNPDVRRVDYSGPSSTHHSSKLEQTGSTRFGWEERVTAVARQKEDLVLDRGYEDFLQPASRTRQALVEH